LRGRERVASGQSSNAAALDQVADALTEENLLVVVPFLAAGELLAMSFPVLLVNTGMSSRRRGQVED
jgi:hypothetical protein